MDQPDQILQELRTNVQTALERSEERLSHVQRQLAGWPALPDVTVATRSETVDGGWKALQDQADVIAGSIDDDLVEVQESLSHFLKKGRELQLSLLPTKQS